MPAVEAVGIWQSRRDFQRVWEGWKAGFLAFHAFHTLSFPWPALDTSFTKPQSLRWLFWEREPLVRDGDFTTLRPRGMYISALKALRFEVFQRLTNPWGTLKTTKVLRGRISCGSDC